MMEINHTCGVCGNASKNLGHTLREMYFGTRETFEYCECSACGVLELLNVPDDLSVYYPNDYYSFAPPRIKSSHNFKRFTNIPFTSTYLSLPKGNACKAFSRLRRIPDDIAKLARMPVTRNSRILDVGCGAGMFLLLLERFGFSQLSGMDKFIDADIVYPSGLTIRQCEMSDIQETYDIVMSHHVFEHLTNPLESIQDMARLTKPGGYVYIRMPNADSFAKRHYETNWIAWDPPRHVFVHTPRTVEILAAKAGLEVAEIFYDSENFQFTGSEQYVKGIPLMQEKIDDVYPKPVKHAYTQMANALNDLKQGDSLCAVLRKPL